MKTRDPSIDSLRGILILLVVLAHLIEPFVLNGDDPIGRMAYILITAMNMPLFIGVSGYLSSSEFGPKEPTFFTFIGIYTLPIYIYHGFIVKLLVHQTPNTTIPLWSIIPVSLGLTAIICIAVTRAPMRQGLDSILSGGGQFKKFFRSN